VSELQIAQADNILGMRGLNADSHGDRQNDSTKLHRHLLTGQSLPAGEPAWLDRFGRKEKLPAQVRNGGALPDARAFAALCRQDRKNDANTKNAVISGEK
jgi:hypothetical protein